MDYLKTEVIAHESAPAEALVLCGENAKIHKGKRFDIDAETWKESIITIRMIKSYSAPKTPLHTIGTTD